MRASARARRGLVLAALALASLTPGPAGAAVVGKPRLVDGASLEIAGQRFRLAGIAAPALDQICRRAGQAYACGQVARAVLWDLIGGREVSCEPVAGAATSDADAIAATCKVDGTDLALAMVAAGWALAERTADASYGALEDDARKARRGLWTGDFEPPRSAREPAP